MKKVGLWLAIVALLVNGPRFVLIFLRIDNIDLPLETEIVMLGATGVATGLVLTGGGAYIAHSLAESRARGMVRVVMMLCWFLLLVFNVILLAPLMVAAIGVSPLRTVLSSSMSQWLWSITAVLAVEIIAAGAMAAYALEGKGEVGSQHETQQGALSILTTALVRRIENRIAPQPPTPVIAPHQGLKDAINNDAPAPDVIDVYETQPQNEKFLASHAVQLEEELAEVEQQTKYVKSERQRQLLELLRTITREADIQVDKLAEKFKVSPQTIYRDLADLKLQKRLKIEDSTVKVLG